MIGRIEWKLFGGHGNGDFTETVWCLRYFFDVLQAGVDIYIKDSSTQYNQDRTPISPNRENIISSNRFGSASNNPILLHLWHHFPVYSTAFFSASDIVVKYLQINTEIDGLFVYEDFAEIPNL